ncbi:protein L [Pseudomonas sp. NPDC090202]|uniref:protein L n=1 Tax=unclassified Pseudomonas TaxID=196821 RepID=UPI0038028308
MALVSPVTRGYVTETLSDNDHWTHAYGVGTAVPVSGIYRCMGCGEEIVSKRGESFPPQNRYQAVCQEKPVLWELVVMTQTVRVATPA